jgi:hypothetical protein
MANYSDDAKYVSAYNKGLAASNKAKAYLSDLNKANPNSAQWKELKAKYDSAKADADVAEAERKARKAEIDNAAKKIIDDKKKAEKKAENVKSASTDIPVLEYQLQVAKNKGDVKAQAEAEAALKIARDKAAGIVTPTNTDGSVDPKTQTQKPEDFAGLLKSAPQFIRKMSETDRKFLAANLNESLGLKIPVVGVYTDALLSAYTGAISGAQAAYNTFKDVFSVNQYLQQKKLETAALKGIGGTSGPSLAQYPVISSNSDAKALFNKVFQSELSRDATDAEIKQLTPLLKAAQAANPESTKSTTINGKKVLERTSGLNTEQWVIDQLSKDAKLKAELDKANLTSPDLAKRLADKKIYDTALTAAGNDPTKIQALKETTAYGRGIKEFENGITQLAFEQGATNTPEEISAIAKALYDKGISAASSTFKTEVNTALKFGADKIGKYTGKAGETFADLATTAAANGLDLQKAFGSNLPNWISAVEKGESIDTYKRIIRDQAKIGMPEKVAKLLDQGVDLETIYTPYKNLMASTLEINPKTITLNDPTLRTAITADAEVPLYQFERDLRRDNRWQYTNQAKSEVSSAAQQVLKDFGFMG